MSCNPNCYRCRVEALGGSTTRPHDVPAPRAEMPEEYAWTKPVMEKPTIAFVRKDGGVDPEQNDDIQRQFEAYHREHPDVYQLLVQFAREVKARCFEQYGIKALWERLRWHYQIEKGIDDEFNLCNNFTSRYARKIMEQESDLKEFFNTRELRSY